MKRLTAALCTFGLVLTVSIFSTSCGNNCESKCAKMKKHYKGKDVAGYVSKCVETCERIVGSK